MDRDFEAQKIVGEIDRLKETTGYGDWDSHGAYPVELHQREEAKACLRTVQRSAGPAFAKPVVSALSDPGVALIWRVKGRGEVDAHFTSRGATYLVLSKDRTLVAKGPIRDYESFATNILTKYLTR